jgi:BASS family bile acid:Na+ symporter
MATLEILLKVTLVIFMVGNLLGMGLHLRLADALRDLRDARFIVASILWGFVLLPGLAYAIVNAIPLAHPYAVGLLLLAMTPCAPFLPPMVERAGGDLGYTAAFMLLASIVTVAYLPFAVPLLIHGFSADPWTIARPLLLFLLAPLLAGLLIQKRSPAAASALAPIVKRVTGIDTLLMLALCVVVYGREFLDLAGSHAIGVQLAFFAVATVSPYLLGFGLPRAQRTVLSLGMATRNLGAAFAPLFAVPGFDQRATVMVALGVLMQAAFSFGAATVYRRAAAGGDGARRAQANPGSER